MPYLTHYNTGEIQFYSKCVYTMCICQYSTVEHTTAHTHTVFTLTNSMVFEFFFFFYRFSILGSPRFAVWYFDLVTCKTKYSQPGLDKGTFFFKYRASILGNKRQTSLNSLYQFNIVRAGLTCSWQKVSQRPV